MNLLDITDLGIDGVAEVLDLARRPIASLGRPLDGRGAALIFEKPSNRTRHSMEIAVVELGGHPVYTRGEEVGFDTREPVEDIGRILAGYHAVIAARVFSHSVVDRLASVSDVPVVNMLSDHSHPLQGLADALTMIEEFGSLDDRIVAWVGDYNNVARSLGEVCSILGAHLRFAGPAGYQVTDDELARFTALGARSVHSSVDPREAVRGAHAVHTDTWVSMGQESEKAERIGIFGRYTVTAELMAEADKESIFMHCLPAYRGLEVEATVIDGPVSRVIRQGHNRLHSARGALAYLMGVR
ncbi:MAG: ornithine carbamoyltransferase [Actinomycetota bacterium]